MKSWNIAACPACGTDQFGFESGHTHTITYPGHLEAAFFCQRERRWFVLGIRNVRGRSEFAWLYANGTPVISPDGKKAPMLFGVEVKP